MKVLITGAAGQLGFELQRTAPVGISLVALSSRECDVGDAAAVAAVMQRESPDVIINAAGYTAVDKAESNQATAERVNATGPANLAASGARLLHVSTDFVFDGLQGRPWKPADPVGPLSVYGRTKLAGEAPVLALGARGLVLRTSWVYSIHGNNFVKTMLKLMASRPELRVVADQIGAPTWARGLADALWRCVQRPALNGLHHWRDAGAASWYDFAVAIGEEAARLGLLASTVAVHPIDTQDYPTPARRPSFSLLDCTATWQALGITPPHWRNQLRNMLESLRNDKHLSRKETSSVRSGTLMGLGKAELKYPVSDVPDLISNWDFARSALTVGYRLRFLPFLWGVRPPVYSCIISPTERKRWVVLFLYTPKGELDASQRFMLSRLRDMNLPLLVVNSSPSVADMPEELGRFCDALIWKSREGYDFSAYAIALHMLSVHSSGCDVLIMNDSVYGPFSDFRPLLQTTRWDLTGFTATAQMGNHIQSYALYLRSLDAATLKALEPVVTLRRAFENMGAVVANQELKLARLASESMTVGACWYADGVRAIDPTLQRPAELLAAGFPFLKKSLFGKFQVFQPAGLCRELLERNGHPIPE